MFKFLRDFHIGLLFLLFAAACGKKEGTSNVDSSGTFTDVYKNTLSTACIVCHVPNDPVYLNRNVHLDFSTQASAYQSLTRQFVSGTSSVGQCPNVAIVSAKGAGYSYLAGVLFADYFASFAANNGGCTPYSVHLQDQNLTVAEKTSLLNWINGGALNN